MGKDIDRTGGQMRKAGMDSRASRGWVAALVTAANETGAGQAIKPLSDDKGLKFCFHHP